MVEVDTEVNGADEAASGLRDIADGISSRLADALREAGQLIVDNAQSAAPVDTGFLRDSIEITEESDTSVTVTASAGYAGFVEYGTRNMDAQPFFEPAIEDAKGEIERIITEAISRM